MPKPPKRRPAVAPDAPIAVEPWIARAKRGPDDMGRCYWEARATIDGERRSRVLIVEGAKWLTRAEAVLVLQRMAVEAASAPVLRGTIAELIGWYLADLDKRKEARDTVVAAGAEPKRGRRPLGISGRTHQLAERNLGVIKEIIGDRSRAQLTRGIYEVVQLELATRGWSSTTIDLS